MCIIIHREGVKEKDKTMNYEYIKQNNDLIKQIPIIMNSDMISLDLETTDLNPRKANLILLQLKFNNSTLVIDLRTVEFKLIKYLLSLLKDGNKLIIGHNIKFDLKMLYHNMGELLTNIYDTMIVEMITTAGLIWKYPSLNELTNKYCAINLDKDLQKSFVNFNGTLTEEQIIYSALDVEYLKDIRERQLKIIDEQRHGQVVDLEMSLIPVFTMMEYDGITLDKEKWSVISNDITNELNTFSTNLKEFIKSNLSFNGYKNLLELADGFGIPVHTKKKKLELSSLSIEFGKEWFMENFNLNSPEQKKRLLNHMGIQVDDTNARTLEKYMKYEIVNKLITYAELEKKFTSYGEPFLNHIDIDGRVHTEFDQIKSTGRIGSSNPNLQNIPRNKMYRDPFIASSGNKILTLDYSQAELRVLGAISREPEFINAFKKGIDMHSQTGTVIKNKPLNQITREDRQDAKNVNFGMAYGISEYGLYRQFNIPIEKGREYLKNYFSYYKILNRFMIETKEKIWELKYSTTPFGRKRFFENRTLYKDSSDRWKYENSVKREGFNHIIQGCVADIVKMSMKDIFYRNSFGSDMRMLLQVHDELVIEAKENVVEDVKEFAKEIMLENESKFLYGLISPEIDYNISEYWGK